MRCFLTRLPIAFIAAASLSVSAYGQGQQSQGQQPWVIFAKRADQLLTPLAAPYTASDLSWKTSVGYRAGLYDSLLGFAHYLEKLSYDGESFRALTDSLMADDLDLTSAQVPEFLTAFFAIAHKVPSHNQRLQNLIVWFGHKVFAPYQSAIRLRLYQLYAQRQRLDLFPGKPQSLLAKVDMPPANGAFHRNSRAIREQIIADLMGRKKGLWAKAALCEALPQLRSACLSQALIESLKINRQRWVGKIQRQRTALFSEPSHSDTLSPALRIKVIHWLTYRGQYTAAAAEFDALASAGDAAPDPSGQLGQELPLNLQQLRLFLLVKTGAFEEFDRFGEQVDALLGAKATAWRQQFAAIDSWADFVQHSGELFTAALDSYSFDPILPWHQRLEAHNAAATELKTFGNNLAQLSHWQRLVRRSHTGLNRDGDMVVVSSLLDDMSAAIVRGSLAEQRQYHSKMSPADRVRLLQACQLILEQDSQFSRYTDAEKLLKASQQALRGHSAMTSWRQSWQSYIRETSAAALTHPRPPELMAGSERAFLNEELFQQINAVQQVMADQRDADRRDILWQRILGRQRSLAHHTTRIQLILEPYRDALRPALDSAYYGQEQYWHRIGGVLSKTYERTKGAISTERKAFAARQVSIIQQTDAMASWHQALRKQEGQLWQAFQSAKPQLLAHFDTMILRQRKLLAKWRTDRIAGRYLAVAGNRQPLSSAEDKLATLASSLKTLKLATWLDWPIINRQ